MLVGALAGLYGATCLRPQDEKDDKDDKKGAAKKPKARKEPNGDAPLAGANNSNAAPPFLQQPAAGEGVHWLEELKGLKDLLDDGCLTQQEFDTHKELLLGHVARLFT
eukprot:TRINITY_DN27785_c0_g1_i1.p3 TRINITY_DN27785_c0_g1~~TRINITY_DN27785_c0_g1_i1.p3  ORF type:complete len:108 (+),score=19.09 TRINITY_DN27785_c0_g1_i1:188-511(+)